MPRNNTDVLMYKLTIPKGKRVYARKPFGGGRISVPTGIMLDYKQSVDVAYACVCLDGIGMCPVDASKIDDGWIDRVGNWRHGKTVKYNRHTIYREAGVSTWGLKR